MPNVRAADGEHRHQDRDHPALLAAQASRTSSAIPAWMAPGLHGDADEAADDEDEQRDVDGAEQLAAVEDVDVAGRRILDAVQAVDRRVERVDEDPLRIRVDLLVRAGDR